METPVTPAVTGVSMLAPGLISRKFAVIASHSSQAVQSEEFTMKRLALIAVIALMPVLSACHTIQGVGKDITAVGKGMEDATH